MSDNASPCVDGMARRAADMAAELAEKARAEVDELRAVLGEPPDSHGRGGSGMQATQARIEAVLGRSPDPAQGIAGSGILGTVTEIHKTLSDERTRSERRMAAWARFGKVLLAVLAGCGSVAAIVGVVEAMHR